TDPSAQTPSPWWLCRPAASVSTRTSCPWRCSWRRSASTEVTTPFTAGVYQSVVSRTFIVTPSLSILGRGPSPSQRVEKLDTLRGGLNPSVYYNAAAPPFLARRANFFARPSRPSPRFRAAAQKICKKRSRPGAARRGGTRLSKNVAVGGHAPTTV